MGNFFTVDVLPDIINGAVANVQNSDKSDLDITAGDLVFDWTAVDVPSGAGLMRSIVASVNHEDGAHNSGSYVDYHLVFAKSINGVAPSSLGSVGSLNTGCFEFADHYIGGAILEASTAEGTVYGPQFQVAYYNKGNKEKDPSGGLPFVVDLESGSGSSVGYDRLYIAGFHMLNRHYGTGVTVDGAITSDTEDTITVADVDPRKVFSVGDTIYVHDNNTALGTVKSMTATTIVLNAAIASGIDLDDDDELLNANPIKIKLGFQK